MLHDDNKKTILLLMVFLTSHASFNIWFCLFPDFTCMKEWTILTFHQTPLEIKWMGSKGLVNPSGPWIPEGPLREGSAWGRRTRGRTPWATKPKRSQGSPHTSRDSPRPRLLLSLNQENKIGSDLTEEPGGSADVRCGKGKVDWFACPIFQSWGRSWLISGNLSFSVNPISYIYVYIRLLVCVCIF